MQREKKIGKEVGVHSYLVSRVREKSEEEDERTCEIEMETLPHLSCLDKLHHDDGVVAGSSGTHTKPPCLGNDPAPTIHARTHARTHT